MAKVLAIDVDPDSLPSSLPAPLPSSPPDASARDRGRSRNDSIQSIDASENEVTVGGHVASGKYMVPVGDAGAPPHPSAPPSIDVKTPPSPKRAGTTGRSGGFKTSPKLAELKTLQGASGTARGEATFVMASPSKLLFERKKPTGFLGRMLGEPPTWLYPGAPVRNSWQVFIFVVIVYNTFITPLRLSIVTDLPNDDPISLIDYVFDFIFLFDTLLHFYLPYTDPSTGSVVTDLAVIKHHYTRSFTFVVNVVATLPIIFFVLTIIGVEEKTGLNRSFVNFLRLVRVVHLSGHFDTLKAQLSRRSPVNESKFRMGIILFTTTIAVSVLGCLYFLVGATDYRDGATSSQDREVRASEASERASEASVPAKRACQRSERASEASRKKW
jgi:hypothetical protein